MQLQDTIANKSVELSPVTFGRDFNEPLIHQVVTAYLAGARSGTKAQLSRSEVRGGGAKPWRQKGNGRARAGTATSPIWVAGGRAFAAKPRDFSQKVNKKMYRAAMSSILSELLRQDRLKLVSDIVPTEPKTKLLLEKIAKYDLPAQDSTLIIVKGHFDNLYLAARNVPRLEVMDVNAVSPVQLVRYNNILVTEDALKTFEEIL